MNKDLKNSLKTVAGDILKIAYNANEDKIKKRLSDAQFRKVRKLANNPELFVKDVIEKRKDQARKYLPIKYDGNFNYGIIASVYNVEAYIGEFFESIKNQSLDFKRHIQIIFVDDGSSDDSAKLIKEYQEKYPKNIHYVYKENGGLSSARNTGIKYIVEQNIPVDFITFPDPDDILRSDYFKSVDDVFFANPNCKIASCNLIYFYEKEGSYKDIHPLKFRYAKTHLSSSNDLGNDILLSAATAFYNLDLVRSSGVRFDENLKPSFEDCKFNSYLLTRSNSMEVAFVNEAKYIYRQRQDNSSLMNGSWQNKGLFLTVLERGVLDIVRYSKQQLGYVPEHIQRVALFHCIGYYRRLVNQPSHVAMLSNDERKAFQDMLYEVFSEYIDASVILKCSFPNLQVKHKIGMLSLYKKMRYPISYVYINNIDIVKKEIEFSFFTGYLDDNIQVFLDNFEVAIVEQKFISNHFLDSNFFYERRMRINYLDDKQNLQISINTKKVNLTCFSASMTGGNQIHELIALMCKKNIYFPVSDSWILMDRKDKADDNAEHFYRYLMNNHPEREVYFAIERDCPDWDRLMADGFRLLEYGSANFEQELQRCKYLLSSHLFVWNYFIKSNPLALQAKRKIWLQHGVICNNNANVVNTKQMDFMLTSTIPENNSIGGEFSEYNLLPSQVLLSGLPRHDSLLQKAQQIDVEKIILVMPTWRTWLDADNFSSSEYFLHWNNFLSSEELHSLLCQYGYKVIFAPHKEIANMGLSFFQNNLIAVWDSNLESMQDLFAKSAFMITDYSSVAFDMAFLNKLVLYYQFDKAEFSSGHYKEGYFDFDDDGFGPVTLNQAELLSSVESILKYGSGAFELYINRISNTFKFSDGNNSERVYQKIIQIEQLENLSGYRLWGREIGNAQSFKYWSWLEAKVELDLKGRYQDELHNQLLLLRYIQSNPTALIAYLTKSGASESEVNYWNAKLGFWLDNFNDWVAIDLEYPFVKTEDKLLLALAHAQLGDVEQLSHTLTRLPTELSEVEQDILSIIRAVLNKEWSVVIGVVDSLLTDKSWHLIDYAQYKPHLLASKAALAMGEYVLSYEYIKKYRGLLSDNYACTFLVSQLDYVKGSYELSIKHIDSLLAQGMKLNKESYLNYLKALVYIQDARIESLIYSEQITEYGYERDEVVGLALQFYYGQSNWRNLVEYSEGLDDAQCKVYNHYIVEALYRLGFLERAYRSLIRPTAAQSYQYWVLVAELAFLMDDIDLQKYCYMGMISIYPEIDKEANIEKFTNLINK